MRIIDVVGRMDYYFGRAPGRLLDDDIDLMRELRINNKGAFTPDTLGLLGATYRARREEMARLGLNPWPAPMSPYGQNEDGPADHTDLDW